ncbi:hypothetical protein DSM106972_041710 [Dulcicalothrix desertica PCC 7102]|uniref:Uncharacterized protein n=2 Tax=Dulcicalothrix desertica TaxID=32056 RepID=A0A433VER0_9CYAN|nr:hypothetical protein DSM106972_041710 [Dulcicalothrix desertica PCC 7102]
MKTLELSNLLEEHFPEVKILNMKELAAKLQQINDGKPGYYLADIADKKYYYCGENLEDIRVKLREIGIGKLEPH